MRLAVAASTTTTTTSRVFSTANRCFGTPLLSCLSSSYCPNNNNHTKKIALFSSSTAWDDMTETTRALVSDLKIKPQQLDNPWKRRRALSQAITLVESSAPAQRQQAALLLTHLLQKEHQTNQGFRVGIAGPPGAGKSTFIEAFGRYVLDELPCSLEMNTTASNATSTTTTTTTTTATTTKDWLPPRLAVVCIDPSSSLTGGSILGDKTRMVELSRHARAFVRPAPASGALGGLAPHTDDVLRLAAAADYELLFVETVGLGQSEIEVRQSVDMLILLVPPAGGDDLQAVKKGILEVTDLLVVTKADGDLLPAARMTAADYKASMPFIRHYENQNSSPAPVLLASSAEGRGLDKIWEHIVKTRQKQLLDGSYIRRRQAQSHYWMWRNLKILVEEETKKNPALQKKAQELMKKLNENNIPPRVAAGELLLALKEEYYT